ncbi:sphingomyelin phosphodiesterase-like [Oscarella lobularis]|uniref:sphingomyelin phosphodiesterase-like n=1 Tax=Oscarella lobularis TaxID=121494 RepID=UPI0033134B4C
MASAFFLRLLFLFSAYSAAPVFKTQGNLSRLLRQIGSIDTKLPTREECDFCKLAVPAIRLLTNWHVSQADIADVIQDVCTLGKIEDSLVCHAIVKEFQMEFFSVVLDTNLTAEELCGRAVGPSCANVSGQNWTVSLSDVPKPPVRPPVTPKSNAPKLRILYLSDVHVDLNYTEELDPNCGEPLCCRPPNKFVGKGGAGKWGDYSCDCPLATMESLLDFIKNNIEFDFVYWTGDVPPHNVWNQTRYDQLHVLDVVIKLLLKYFPNKVIYPALGNHESAPVNSYPPPFVKGQNSEAWLYNAIVKDWSPWLPNETTPTLSYGGFYSVQPATNFRVISLNVNYCSNLNFWVFINETDPAGQLQWLVNELQDAENKGQKVHIIGHIPPNKGCLTAWSANYEKIVNRYENTIAAQIYGHTHETHISVYFNNSRPVNVLYTGPSVTTYKELNPAFRVYEVDGIYKDSTFGILDYTDYIMNLTEANLTPNASPRWRKEYSARDAYNLTSLFPSGWANFIERCKEDDSLLQLYNKYRRHSHVTSPCDKSCQLSLLCEMEQSRVGVPCAERFPGYAKNDLC